MQKHFLTALIPIVSRFTQSNSLKAHRLIHTGDKPVFQCELCPTTCGRKTDLRLHVQKLHTAEQPMHCKMCGKSFPDRYTLKVGSLKCLLWTRYSKVMSLVF